MTRKIMVNIHITPDGHGEFPKYPRSDVPSDQGRANPASGFERLDVDIFRQTY